MQFVKYIGGYLLNGASPTRSDYNRGICRTISELCIIPVFAGKNIKDIKSGDIRYYSEYIKAIDDATDDEEQSCEKILTAEEWKQIANLKTGMIKDGLPEIYKKLVLGLAEMIPFSEEMEHTDTFIELAKVLPSKKFEVEKDFQITDFNVPALVVQPLVENAIKYGIGMSSEGDKVVIQTMVEKGYVLIKVKDNGHGERTELPTQKKRQSVGTKNVRTRLSILCDGELSINKTDKGTEAVIKIP
jgi:hypothetical protein